jgi:DNA transformation protein
MTVNSSFLGNVLEQLSVVDGIATRRLFGGVGIYRYGVMFALVVDERLYFKVNAENKLNFQQAGCVPFIYNRHDKEGGKKLVTMSYWEVPPQVMEDKELFFQWAIKAYEAAVKTKHKEAV